MNIGLIGSGGREHALCCKIFESRLTNKIYCFPGNSGTKEIALNIDVDILNFKKILKLIKFYKIDLVIVGPEEPLVKGIVDFLTKNKIKVFGPNKFASQLEGSKAFMKKICNLNNIPTANYKICKNKREVLNFLEESKLPIVVKADGLAAGKGVTICKTKKQVSNVSNQIFMGKFKSSRKLVLEEFLSGEEASYFLVVDKNNFKFFGTAQDHKRVGENDIGPNTGGMGAYSPAKVINKNVERKIINKIVKPTLKALKNKNKHYKGFLYVGLMIKNGEPYLIEFNVRMGDPECQTILPLLKSDLGEIILSCCNQNLSSQKIEWLYKKSLCIVLCSNGYPGEYKKKVIIKNTDNLNLQEGQYLIHAGTKYIDKDLYSYGGRVLNIVVTSNTFENSRKKALEILDKINWRNGFYRKDIGYNVINT